MKVYEAVAHAFVKEGTSVVFGLLGDGQLNWWSFMAKLPQVEMIDVRDEGAALTMAEGWAMAGKQVGVCSVTHGPGITRMATSLVAATRSRTPIVIYTSKTPFNNTKNPQNLSQEPFVIATGAGYIEVLTPGFAEAAVRQAFYRARLEARPIVLAVPMDIQNKECDSEGDDYQPSTAMYPGQQRIRPALAQLKQAVEIIAASKKPVLILGRGAMEPGTLERAKRCAERIGALIATTLIAKGVGADDEFHAGISGLFSTRAVMQLFAEADCVIALGAGMNERTIEGGYLYPEARIIQIDVQPHIVMGNDKSADCYIQGDAAMTIQEIDDMLVHKGIAMEGYRTAAVRKVLRDADRDPQEFEIEPGTVDPREAVRVLDDGLPSDVGFVTGPGHAFSFPIMGMKKRRPVQVYVTGFGSIGQAIATAIGVSVAVKQPIVYMEGDGSALQNIQELDTAARLGLKILFVILNDEAYGAEYHKLNASGFNGKLSIIRSPNFATVARGFGARGAIARDLAAVENCVAEFLAGDGPMVLDLRISRNVLSIPYRRLHYGQDA